VAKPPFRAEHVGSLLRPEPLRAARDRVEGDVYRTVRGSRRFKELEPLEDAAIVAAIQGQEKAGLQVITDGEMRRRSWFQDFVLEYDGTAIEFADFAIAFTDAAGHKLPSVTVRVDGKLRRRHSCGAGPFRFLASHTTRTPKITMPSPPIFHFFGGRLSIDRAAYPDLDEFWADLARSYREEIAELASLGCTYMQLDEVILAVMCDPRFRAQLAARGDDPTTLLSTYARVINDAIADRPPGVVIGMHLCRGNNRGQWMAEGGYDFVSDVLFNTVHVDAYFMEYDSPRAGDFAPLRHLPKGKTAVLGLVTTKSPALEPADALKRRIDEAARFAPLDQLALSPQCGFASHFLGNPLSPDDQWRKLERIVAVAESVWGSA
jgi:methionine synthase II (cobalamin-independent)